MFLASLVSHQGASPYTKMGYVDSGPQSGAVQLGCPEECTISPPCCGGRRDGRGSSHGRHGTPGPGPSWRLPQTVARDPRIVKKLPLRKEVAPLCLHPYGALVPITRETIGHRLVFRPRGVCVLRLFIPNLPEVPFLRGLRVAAKSLIPTDPVPVVHGLRTTHSNRKRQEVWHCLRVSWPSTASSKQWHTGFLARQNRNQIVGRTSGPSRRTRGPSYEHARTARGCTRTKTLSRLTV